MYVILDSVMLILYGLLSLAEVTPDAGYVIALLTGLAVNAYGYAAFSGWLRAGLFCGYLVLSCFLPDCLFFLPLAAYHSMLQPDAGTVLRGFWERKKQREEENRGQVLLCVLFLLLRLFLLLADILRQEESAHLLFFAGTGLALAVFLRSCRDRLERMEEALRRTRDDDEEIRLLLKEKNRALLEKQDHEIDMATLRERNRIAREIHDNVGHLLTRAILLTGAMRTVQRQELQEPLGLLERTLNDAMDSIRKSVHDLHDSSVDLREMLEQMTSEFTFCPVSLLCEEVRDMPVRIKYSFLSIIKEALANIAKHSHATKAEIVLREQPGFYQLVIRDNGCGLKQQNARAFSGPAPVSFRRSPPDSGQTAEVDPEELPEGIGLKNMQERVLSWKGHFRIQSGNGFCIYITVPVKTEEERQNEGFTD